MLVHSSGVSLLDIFFPCVSMFVYVGLIFSTVDIYPYVRTFENYYFYLLDVCPSVSIFVINMLLVVSP